MEALYLLCSIMSTSLTSLLLSLLLPLRLLFRRLSTQSAVCGGEEAVSLYQGAVWHERRRPLHHSFRYAVRYALIDLDHAPRAPPDHLSADQARSAAETNGPVFLLTIPPSVGYEQNPLSLYYCYDVEGSTCNLRKCIAEDMLGNWSIRTKAPGDSIFVAISVQHPNLGDYFTATLRAKRISLLENDYALFFWLMPHKVALWIYWHALKLWWKGVPFIQHPRYSNPEYRHEALIRDSKLTCPQGIHNDLPHEGSGSDSVKGMNGRNRCFTWRDAKWPWC
ncbi:uncharacterized protein LOC127793068 isoform X2 [Diospyros lotus]|uniref:uncharacterized protein LOC127793068 isoform X2 n=1 Tax=Diospyros lotus TaxID=55363 RepID=UPI002259F78A|nr:uncharacterized protein LOC127793068 isoform X2 [Diospyros lotus]